MQPENNFALPVGARVLGYDIVRILGTGGFGIVYEGFNRGLDHRAAIKEFFPRQMAHRQGQYVILNSDQDRDLYQRILKRFARCFLWLKA